MARNVHNEKKKINPILWLLFAVIIPLLIVIAIIVVILNFSGFSVIDWTKEKGSELPVISNFITNPEEDALDEEVSRLTEELETKTIEVEQLEAQIADLEMTMDQREQDAAREEATNAPDESADEDAENETIEEIDESLRDMAKTFEEMKAAGAAAILGNMDEEQIVLILRELPNDARGDILQAMEAELAATLAAEMLD
ncbi:magnesium transporter MgtE N-terminal domain-containing protein [Oceanobacillus alkalisoli]|uniref:magnesium transporter MgtE N-terminal domain-containing protein n=1 Tax=Oceanobacillus alkalisoli TaxID=2925113 RepID=UPI001EE46CE8|nr:hypothetical protein [Oceanobacillus alkalisoli]MCG5103488.1 hypothetical protein [Oceanobacillus alkalisoli]